MILPLTFVSTLQKTNPARVHSRLRPRFKPFSIAVGCLSFCCLALGDSANAADWPQWMGPNRNNVLTYFPTIESFPANGPNILWTTPVAGGYAGPAVAAGKVFVQDFVTDADVKVANFNRAESVGTERTLCLEESTGKVLWRHEYSVKYTISYPAGPRCTPIVEGNRVYALGAEGNLTCLNSDDGTVIWEKDLKAEYQTEAALWGYAAHPLIDGDRLICVVGGEGTQTVAFEKMTGKELWRHGTAAEQGYSPPTIIALNGKRQLILANPFAIDAVDPITGEELWTTPYEASSGSMIMSPILVDDYLFQGGYSKRNVMLKLTNETPGVEVLWRDKPKLGLSPVNVQPIAVGDIIYGMDQSGDLMAFKVPSGERLWSTPKVLGDRAAGNDTAFIVKNGDQFLLFNEKGEIVVATMSADGFKEITRAKVIEPTNSAFGRPVVWCAPAYSDGKMYVRNDEECVCIQLAPMQ